MASFQNWIRELDRPAPYQPGAPFWTHPHIAAEMLKTHLDPATDAASYRPETIRAICAHLWTAMGLAPGSRLIDLGCGPGLYCRALAGMGASVTGLDQSQNSLRYARKLCAGLDAGFVRASYLDPFGTEAFDAAILISQDYGVLSPENRRALLGNVRNALKPGGLLALDAPSRAAYAARREATEWETSPGGFWRPHPYLLLHAVRLYPEIAALCDLYAVLDGRRTVYRVWQTFFSPESLTRELTEAGFTVEAVWADLLGNVPDDASPAVGVLCRRA